MIVDFKAALEAAFCPTDTEIVADDRINRFHIIGDPKSKLAGRYRLACDGQFYYGWFIGKDQVRHDFHSRTEAVSDEQRARNAEIIKAQRQESNRTRLEERRKASELARYIWSKSTPAPATEPYLARKGVAAHSLRVNRGALICPMFAISGDLVGLQFISGTDKRYLKNCEKGIITLPGAGAVALCEGYATGATIHAATGWTVIVCFDSGQVKVVAGKIRQLYPNDEIVVCADDDAYKFRPPNKPPEVLPPGDSPLWIEWRGKNMLYNAGIEAATAAIKKVGGNARLKSPRFENTASHPTDFNDLQALQGIEAVKRQLLGLQDEAPPAAEYEDMSGWIPCYDPEDVEPRKNSSPFKVMGYNKGVYYYLPRHVGQLVALTPTAHTDQNLNQLAPPDFWFRTFGNAKGEVKWKAVSAALMQLCHDTGVFETETMMRGAGIWMDKGRVVVHCGDKLVVDGVDTDPFEFGSAYVYQKRTKVFGIGSPLNDDEAKKLKTICEQVSFTNTLSPILLTGWIVMAPICGLLEWRPHIWIDGEMEAGKSYVMNHIIKKTLDKIAIRLGSGSTEPGLRRMIGIDSRPIIMDEMESENEQDQENLQKILLLARKASSGESIIQADQQRGGVAVYNIFSTFCMSSINSAVKQRADLSRFSHLDIKKNRSPTASEDFKRLKTMVKETLTEEYSQDLLARTLKNIRVILKNVEIFTEAAADVLKTRRAGDQIGAMLAGAFSLYSDRVIGLEAAKKWIEGNNWGQHTAINEQSDNDKLFGHIMASRVRITGSSRTHESQIGEAILVALGLERDGPYMASEAKVALKAIDIQIRKDAVWFKKPSQHIERIVRGTPWASSWAKALCNIGGVRLSDKAEYCNGSTSFMVIVPTSKFEEGITQPSFRLDEVEEITI